jgi:hypothetical protein
MREVPQSTILIYTKFRIPNYQFFMLKKLNNKRVKLREKIHVDFLILL